MKGKVKKVLGFVTCSSAFNQRNISSVLLVALFFGAYVMAGGKINTKLPDIQRAKALQDPNMGAPATGLSTEERQRIQREIALGEAMPDLTEKESKEVLGVVPSKEREARARISRTEGLRFTAEERKQLEEEKINEELLIQGADFTNRREQWRLEQAEKKPTDSLSIIEERLQIKKR